METTCTDISPRSMVASSVFDYNQTNKGGTVCIEGRYLIIASVRETNGRYFAEVLTEPNIPYHGEGSDPEEAMDALSEALIMAWESVHYARKLSPHMEKIKTLVGDLFSYSSYT